MISSCVATLRQFCNWTGIARVKSLLIRRLYIAFPAAQPNLQLRFFCWRVVTLRSAGKQPGLFERLLLYRAVCFLFCTGSAQPFLAIQYFIRPHILTIAADDSGDFLVVSSS